MTRTRRPVWRQLAVASLVMIAAYPVFNVLVYAHGWRTSDWDGDGRTTLGEWIYGMEIATREVRVAGRTCVEYFSAKDGLPVRVDCPPPEG
jgi:hypothetical protein